MLELHIKSATLPPNKKMVNKCNQILSKYDLGKFDKTIQERLKTYFIINGYNNKELEWVYSCSNLIFLTFFTLHLN